MKEKYKDILVSLILLIITGACCYSLFLAYSVIFGEW